MFSLNFVTKHIKPLKCWLKVTFLNSASSVVDIRKNYIIFMSLHCVYVLFMILKHVELLLKVLEKK